MNVEQLKDWKHPSPYDFHYSEFWRARYENDLSKGTDHYLNEEQMNDPELAAHFTITIHRGICIEGRPIKELFTRVPRAHYISSIMSDFQDCLENIEQDPTYCVLNLIRVYWYLKEGVISSKKEAGKWGMATLPKKLSKTVQKAVNNYQNVKQTHDLKMTELLSFSEYIKRNVQALPQ